MRTPVDERKLPDYTRGEEIFNMVTHIVGGGFGVIALVLCSIFSIRRHDWLAFGSGAFYGMMMIFLYTMSSIYHGLTRIHAKKVFQVIDHCTIYALIIGTYIPILLTGLWDRYRTLAIVILCIIAVGTATGVTFTAIDFHLFRIISYSCYFVVGWSAIFIIKPIIISFGLPFFLWILAGGLFYTFGMIFFTKGIHKRWYHSIFHIFIIFGSVLQFVGILIYCMMR